MAIFNGVKILAGVYQGAQIGISVTIGTNEAETSNATLARLNDYSLTDLDDKALSEFY